MVKHEFIFKAFVADEDLLKILSNGPDHGTIHSVFHRTVNFVLEGCDNINTISLFMDGAAPDTITLTPDDTFDFLSAGIQPGDEVLIDNGEIVISGNIQISIKPCNPVSLCIDNSVEAVPVIDKNKTILFEKTLKEYGNTHAACLKETEGTTNSIEASVNASINLIYYEALCSDGYNATLQALLNLIGLGVGLTPSGDDIICGYLCGYAFYFGSLSKRNTELSSAVLKKINGTNDISRMMLRNALSGKFRQSEITLLNSAFNGTDNELINSIRTVIGIGSTSGTDFCFGVLLFLHKLLSTDNHL